MEKNKLQSWKIKLYFEAFGRSDESLNKFLDGDLLIYGPEVQKILEYGDLLVTQARNPQSRTGLVRAVLAGKRGGIDNNKISPIKLNFLFNSNWISAEQKIDKIENLEIILNFQERLSLAFLV